jgi:hypothetical protein
MSSCILEILELDELYKRKENLLLQLFLVDKEIKKRLSENDTMNVLKLKLSRDKELFSGTLVEENINNISIIKDDNIKQSCITDIKENNVKKITIRIKKV